MSKHSFFDDYMNIPDEYDNENEGFNEYEEELSEEEWRKLCEERGIDPDATEYIDYEYDLEDDEYDEYDEEEDWDEDDEDEYADIDPNDYTEDMVEAMNEVIRVESGIDEPGNSYNIQVLIPMLITPVNKYLRFIKYPYNKSMIIELLNKGWTIENAISYTCQERIQNYVNDYVLKDENDNLVYEEELSEYDIEDDMYPDVNEPYWIINI